MKKEYYTVYSREGDMTFIMMDVYNEDGDPVSTECVGWHYGEPYADSVNDFAGKLKAEY